MLDVALHHVSVPSSELTRSREFYEGILGLRPMERPPFAVEGIWYAVGPLQIHLVVHAAANFRTSVSTMTTFILRSGPRTYR
jgi:glyoxylase I family protein